MAPHMLTYGSFPRSPTDAWCRNLKGDEVNTHGEFLSTVQERKEQLGNIAMENSEKSLGMVRNKYNQDRKESNIKRESKVMLKVNARTEALDPRFEGPYEVIDRKGHEVKVRRRKKIK